MARTMYDAVTPSNLPDGGDLYAGYVDGHYANVAAVRAMFPGKKVVTITVTGNVEADVVDVETGDVTPAHAPAWVQRMRAAGRTPTVYCPESMWPAVRAAFAQQGVSEPSYWIANYTSGPAIPAGAVAHQYGGTGGHDISSVADYWPGVDAPPVAPLAAPQPKEYLNVNVLSHPVVMTLGADGKGWSLTADSVVNPFIAKEDGHYYGIGDPNTYAEDVLEWYSFVQAGRVEIVVAAGRPGAVVSFEVLEFVPA